MAHRRSAAQSTSPGPERTVPAAHRPVDGCPREREHPPPRRGGRGDRRFRLRFDGLGAPIGAPSGEDLPVAARILRVAADFDEGMSQRPSVQDSHNVMRSNAGAYDPRVLEALVRCHAAPEMAGAPREIAVEQLRSGMVVFDDVFSSEDILLISRGTEVTEPLIMRLENYASQGRLGRRIRVRG